MKLKAVTFFTLINHSLRADAKDVLVQMQVVSLPYQEDQKEAIEFYKEAARDILEENLEEETYSSIEEVKSLFGDK